eukprot:gene3541-3992_t
MSWRVIAFVALTSGASAAAAEIAFASVFAGGAVLQREVFTSVWGNSTLTPGAAVELLVDGKLAASATTGPRGQWRAWLPAQPTTWESTLTVRADPATSASITVRFGHVLLCSGQSNMQMPVNNWEAGGFCAANGTAESNAAGRYTGKIQLMTNQPPFPRPTKPSWNGTNCPRGPHTPPGCVAEPQ